MKNVLEENETLTQSVYDSGRPPGFTNLWAKNFLEKTG